jgi:type I restriction enzyme, S subunit
MKAKPKDWELKFISEICEVVSGGTPSTKNKLFWNGEIPWVTPKDLSVLDKKYISRGERNITKDGLNRSNIKLLPRNTLLFTSRAPIGYLAISKNSLTTNQGFKNLIPNEEVDVEFLYYLIKKNTEYIKTFSSGSTFQEIPASMLKLIKLPIPELKEQKSIAKIFKILDDKIELNDKINSILEQISQTIFKHWFIDFEFPNEQGKPYKSSGGEFTDSELGKIPKEWKVKNFKSLADIFSGKGLSKDKVADDGMYPIYGANGTIGYTNKYLFDEDLILTGRVGTLGKIYMVNEKVWVSDNVLISKPKSKIFTYFIYFFLKKLNLSYLNRGSTQPLITKTDISKLKIIIPPDYVFINFDGIVRSNQRLIILLNKQNKILSQIRDTLLPKLITGKIRVNLKDDKEG